jgi:hypothetical protein
LLYGQERKALQDIQDLWERKEYRELKDWQEPPLTQEHRVYRENKELLDLLSGQEPQEHREYKDLQENRE